MSPACTPRRITTIEVAIEYIPSWLGSTQRLTAIMARKLAQLTTAWSASAIRCPPRFPRSGLTDLARNPDDRISPSKTDLAAEESNIHVIPARNQARAASGGCVRTDRL